MNRAARFTPDDFGEALVRIAERVHGNSAEKIEINAAAIVVKVAAFAVRKDERRPPVRVHQMMRFVAASLCRGARRRRFLFHSAAAFASSTLNIGVTSVPGAFSPFAADSKRVRPRPAHDSHLPHPAGQRAF